MNLEGRIAIPLSPTEDNAHRVAINSTRPVHACQMFHGKSIDETLKALPLLFSICGTAQAAAAVRACEQALDHSPSIKSEKIRQQLVALETIREHLWRTLLGWGASLGEPLSEQTMARVMTLQQQMRKALTGDTSPFQLQPQLSPSDSLMVSTLQQQLIEIVEHSLLGISIAQWESITSLDAFWGWSKQQKTVATRFIQQLEHAGWNHLGECDSSLLPTLETELIHQQLDQADFIAQPLWKAIPRETTPFSRTQSPLLTTLYTHYGNGLLTRSVARLTELFQQLTQLLNPASQSSIATYQPSVGIGLSTAARGQLLHRVAVENSQIIRYQILAPTEWNFHPQGVVTQALQQLEPDTATVKQQASLIIHAIDPCVGYDLTLNPTGTEC